MSLDKATVAKIAHLARIAMTDEELAPLTDELSGILTWIEQLDEVETAGVEPMASASDQGLRWREDAVTDGRVPDRVLANAPAEKGGFFAVPKVVE